MRVATALAVCPSMQASRFQIPAPWCRKKARDEGSIGSWRRLDPRQAFPGFAKFFSVFASVVLVHLRILTSIYIVHAES